jgi:hypothetical protein
MAPRHGTAQSFFDRVEPVRASVCSDHAGSVLIGC